MTTHMGPRDNPGPKDYCVAQFEDRILSLALGLQPIPMEVPMARNKIISSLRRAQVAEIRNPQPEDLLKAEDDFGNKWTVD